MPLNFPPSSAPLRTIKEIQFGILSPEEIKSFSVCHVEYPETMDEARIRPREKGLNDPHLGTIDRGTKCLTCDEAMNECPGHFGHIELAKPVFHVGFLVKIKKILETVCVNCGKIKVDENNEQFKSAIRIREPKARFNRIWGLAKTKNVCDSDIPAEDEDFDGPQPNASKKKDNKKFAHGGCGNQQPQIRKEGLKLFMVFKGKDEEGRAAQNDRKHISPAECTRIFKLISDEEVNLMGLNKDYARPEWMIISVLPVPPPPVRPSISMDGMAGSSRSEDDLTYKLGDIIRANANVRRAELEGVPQHIVTEYEDLLQFHVATYFDNDLAGQPKALQKSGRPIKSIRARLKGKEGRLRGNLMGKRVDFSARTVITGDPNLSLDEVGVPRSIARTLTYPETCTPYNIAKLQTLVRNGPNTHPGAKYVIRDTGERIDLRHHKRAGDIALQYGWTVERHIVDGDYIIFNRQPSLHKESMMGHRVRVMPYSTFRLNLSVTSPYNADFDGDEMNLHVPQSEETRAELQQLCMVPLQIVSPQRNGPLMGIVQDTLCGVYKICRKDIFLTRDQVMQILLWVPNWDGVVPTPAIIKPQPRWTGKQIVSLIIPSGINYDSLGDAKDWAPADDDGACVHGGEIMFGLMKKKIVGATGGGLIHIIYNEKGWEAALEFFNGCQTVVNYWLLHNGFSIGIGDTIPDPATVSKIENIVQGHKGSVVQLMKDAQDDKLEPLPGMNIRETFESKVSKALNSARDDAGRDTEASLKDLNNATVMARSGSKGSNINISQMMALVGQQSVEGKRIPFGFQYRTLPHFAKDDYSPESRGFVENSYLRGLTPQEFFFHAMAGREGLIDTAVKTAETGYIQRRLVKALEDVMAKYDGTVRNSLGDIIQFVYGEDGLDGQYVEFQKIDIMTPSDEAIQRDYRVDVMDPKMALKPDKLASAIDIQGDPDVQRALDEEFEAIQEARRFIRDLAPIRGDERAADDQFPLPTNVKRIIENARSIFKVKDGHASDLNPVYVVKEVNNLIERLVVVRGDDSLSLEAQHNALKLFSSLLRSRLAFKKLVAQNFNKVAFDWALGEIQNRFARSAVSPGEMVGVLAAQSIGEPATQMTLNTFHFAGVSSKNVTLGVPRLKEILNVAKNIKTPSLQVYQIPQNKYDKEKAKELRSLVEHTTLRSVTQSAEIYYDPEPTTTVVPEDKAWVDDFFLIPDEEILQNLNSQSRWMLRIVLDRMSLLDKGLEVADVARKVQEIFGSDLTCIFSDNNANNLVIRCRLVEQGSKDDDSKHEEDLMLKQVQNHMLDELTLRGVRGIERAFLNDKPRVRVFEDGELKIVKSDPKCTEWMLDTSGSNLADVLVVEGVDPTRTYSNSFVEILQVFGIEATRAALMRELTAVLAFDGSYVNHRHLALLCDVMTCRGHLMAITRHGINRADTGALMRCSFEETVEILLDAAAAGELDDCRAVSENVMLGQLAPMGTGEFDVFLDEEMLNQVIVDNSRLNLANAGFNPRPSGVMDGEATPYDGNSPMYDNNDIGSPYLGAQFSPIAQSNSDAPHGFTEYQPNAYGGSGAFSPFMGGTSPAYSPHSPYNATPASPRFGASSPAYMPTSPMMSASPAFTPASPGYSPASPAFAGVSRISPSSPNFSPASPTYSPASPNYNAGSSISPASPAYSPTSPKYSPTSPNLAATSYSPTSPAYSPTSPSGGYNRASPTSPQHRYSPTSPQYTPTSPTFNANSTSPRFSPTSPGYSPQSPAYSPTSPAHRDSSRK